MLACLAYIIIHTRSLFLGVFSLLNVCMSIPITLVLYKLVFGIHYFSNIQISAIIIIIGIGADDIFVFHQ